VHFLPGGQSLLLRSSVPLWGTVTIRDVDGTKPSRSVAGIESVFFMAVSPDGKVLATSAGDDLITLHDLETKAELCQLAHREPSPRCLTFSPDGKVLAAGCRDGQILLWDVARRK